MNISEFWFVILFRIIIFLTAKTNHPFLATRGLTERMSHNLYANIVGQERYEGSVCDGFPPNLPSFSVGIFRRSLSCIEIKLYNLTKKNDRIFRVHIFRLRWGNREWVDCAVCVWTRSMFVYDVYRARPLEYYLGKMWKCLHLIAHVFSLLRCCCGVTDAIAVCGVHTERRHTF